MQKPTKLINLKEQKYSPTEELPMPMIEKKKSAISAIPNNTAIPNITAIAKEIV